MHPNSPGKKKIRNIERKHARASIPFDTRFVLLLSLENIDRIEPVREGFETVYHDPDAIHKTVH